MTVINGVEAKTKAVLTSWKEIENEQLMPLIQRQYLSTQTMTIARFNLAAGSSVPTHQHVNEQLSYVVTGRMKFVFPDSEVMVGAGEVLCIPANLPHSAHAIEDTYAIDVFTPNRADWESKNDGYLRGK